MGIIGIHPYSERRREGFFTSIGDGFVTANVMTAQTVKYLGMLFTGKMGVQTLGGPITVTKWRATSPIGVSTICSDS